MSNQSRMRRLFRRGDAPRTEAAAISRESGGGEGFIARTICQLRDAFLAPLKPFPLAHVANGFTSGLHHGSLAEVGFHHREPHLPLGVTGLSTATLKHAHAFITMLPDWLPAPERRRHGNGQVVLEWSGGSSRRFSVVVGPDGMLIYAARLGARGRFDGAEPIGTQLSPIVLHALDQLRD